MTTAALDRAEVALQARATGHVSIPGYAATGYVMKLTSNPAHAIYAIWFVDMLSGAVGEGMTITVPNTTSAHRKAAMWAATALDGWLIGVGIKNPTDPVITPAPADEGSVTTAHRNCVVCDNQIDAAEGMARCSGSASATQSYDSYREHWATWTR